MTLATGTPPNRRLLLVQMGDPPDDIAGPLGNQPAWFVAALGDSDRPVQVVRPFLGDTLPDAADFHATVITGSWSMVTDREDWSERTGAWLREVIVTGHRVLGVCYGHQLMADVMGGTVDYHPDGAEVGVKTVTLSAAAADDALFAGFATQFTAPLSHSQSVLVPPPGAVVLGASSHDACQILRYGPNAVSVQFHPEFTPALMQACTDRRASHADSAAPPDTPTARDVLRRFIGA